MKSCNPGDEIVAPRVKSCKLPFFQDGLLWEIPVQHGPAEGWGLWRIQDFQARYVRPATAWERERALPEGRRGSLTLTSRLKPGTWQASGPGKAQVIVHLVDQGAKLDQVRAVCDGLRWWCLGLASGQSRRARRWRAERTAGEVPPDLKPGLKTVKPDISDEGRIRRAVELAGGRLLRWSATPNGFEVGWTRNGVSLTSLVDRDLNLQRAGLCLANTDREHDLTTLVSLIPERSAAEYDYHQMGWS